MLRDGSRWDGEGTGIASIVTTTLADVVHARVARVGAGAVVEGRADGEAPAVRAQRDRSARLVGRRLAVDVAAELGPGRSIILEDPRVALAVMPLLPNGKAPAVRTQRDRSARQVCRRPAIDVAAELGPGRAGVLEDTRLASEKTSAGVGVRPDGEACAVRAQRNRETRLVARRLAVDVSAELVGAVVGTL